jgi:hydroxyacylglutathione hydrolase
MKLLENLYVFLWNDQRENNCNSILIDGKIPLLIDPGHLHRVTYLLDRVESSGLDPADIKAVICTHGHPDHFEGTLAFKDRDAKIGISRQEERFIEDVGRPMYLQQGLSMPEFKVDFYLTEGTLTIGKHEFEVLLTPGHSPGSICLYWPRHKVLIAGDLVFLQSVGRTDFPGGDSKLLMQSIERISKLRVEYIVSGHGPVISGSGRVRANFDLIKRSFFGA